MEATLVALRSGLRLAQVQVRMRERETGASSITFVRSLYYVAKVTLALLVASLRRYPRVESARTMTPLRVSIVGVVASALLILIVLELIRGRRLKERYALLWLATGVVLLVLSALARRPEHDRRLARSHRLPAGGSLRGRDALHPPRAPPLLDRAVEADGRERGARAADRAARGTRVRVRYGVARPG